MLRFNLLKTRQMMSYLKHDVSKPTVWHKVPGYTLHVLTITELQTEEDVVRKYR
jgi:hypothetical protein